MSNLNFTSANPSLAKVALFPSQRNYVGLNVKHLPDAEQAETLQALQALNPEVFATIDEPTEIQVSLLRYEGGVYQKAYPMSIHAYDGQLALQLNKVVMPLGDLDEFMPEFGLVQVEKYSELCLTLTFENDDDMTVVSFPLRLNSEGFKASNKDPNMFAKKTALAFKKGNLDWITSQLVEAKAGGASGGGNRLPVVPIRELPELEDIQVKAAKKVDISGRVSYVLTVSHEGNDVNVWAPSSIKNILELGGEITEDTTMMYSSYTNRSGKSCINAKLIGYATPQAGSRSRSSPV